MKTTLKTKQSAQGNPTRQRMDLNPRHSDAGIDNIPRFLLSRLKAV